MTWQHRLRFAIARSGKAHDEVAYEAGVSPATLRRILDGELDPDLEDVARLARVVHVTVGSLLGERPTTVRLVEGEEIPRMYAARGATVVYEVVGDTLTREGILDGDLLFVRPTNDIDEAGAQPTVCRIGGEQYVRVLRDRDIDDETFELLGIVIGRSGPVA
ncbi:MAG TPA: helix-turn-helix domain-containing protein [Thermoanaerobaculia bacterium]